MAEASNRSPRVQSQLQLARSLNEGPRATTQMRLAELLPARNRLAQMKLPGGSRGLASEPAQRFQDEEETAQAKCAGAAKAGPSLEGEEQAETSLEAEEMVQGKFASIQRKEGTNDEDYIQAKLATGQREEGTDDEDYPMQAKLDTAQREEGTDDEDYPMQAKLDTAQREEGTDDEDYPMQAKLDTAQREEGTDDEDYPMQAKLDTAQREEGTDDEDYPMQAKSNPIQRLSGLNAESIQREPSTAGPQNRTGLPDNLKTGIENLSGRSLDDVKVHYNSAKPAQLNALAYTQGKDIHVGPGQQEHLAHEAWHAVQQAEGRVRPTMQMRGTSINDDSAVEREADEMGARAISGDAAQVHGLQSTEARDKSTISTRGGATGERGPLQLTRDEAKSVVKGTFNEEPDVLETVQNGNLPPMYRLTLLLINNHGLSPQDPNYIPFEPSWFPRLSQKQIEAEASKDITQDVLYRTHVLAAPETGPSPMEVEEQRSRQEASTKLTRHKRVLSKGGKEEREPEPKRQHLEGTGEPTGEEFQTDLSLIGGITETEETRTEVEGPERLGIVSWNVAHFSARDIDKVFKDFQSQFATFSGEDWQGLFDKLALFDKTIQRQLNSFKGEAKTEKSEQELKKDHPEIFKGLSDPETKLRQLADLLQRVRTVSAEIDVGEFEVEIGKIVSTKWESSFTEAKLDKEARAAFADKIKQLRKFDSLAEPAKETTTAIYELVSQSHLKTLLKRMAGDAYEALFTAVKKVRKALPKINAIVELGRALHSFNIMTHIDEMFENNKWLDLMALQEVNDPTLLKQKEYTLQTGPLLSSGGQTPQQEYYPLLVRKGSNIKVEAVYVVTTAGEMEEVGHGQQVDWNKRNDSYRPIIVYEIKKGEEGKLIWVGIVHTTPEPDTKKQVAEFNRRKIYKEIEAGLQTLSSLAEDRGIPLIIGGDYYLTSEALVKDLQGEKLDPEEDVDLATATEIEDIRKKTGKLKTILKYQLAKEIEKTESQEEEEEEEEESEQELEGPENVSEEEIAEVEEGTKKILEIEQGRNKIEVLRERIKFLNQALNDDQLLKNYFGLTVKNQIEDIGLLVAQTVSGTNPKKDPLERWFDLQIADFFVHNEQWKSVELGIVRPEGKLLTVDAEDRRYSRYWQRFSDHFPVGGVFSLSKENLRQSAAFVKTSGTEQSALELNITRFAEHHVAKTSDMESRPLLRAFVDSVEPPTKIEFARLYLKNRLDGLLRECHEERGFEELVLGEPHDIKGYIEAIQYLEEILDVEDSERLVVIRPEDFEPAYGKQESQATVGTESKKRKPDAEDKGLGGKEEVSEDEDLGGKEEESEEEYELKKGKWKGKEKELEPKSTGSKPGGHNVEDEKAYLELERQRQETEADFHLEQGGGLTPDDLTDLAGAINYLMAIYSCRIRTIAGRKEFFAKLNERYSKRLTELLLLRFQTDTSDTRLQFYNEERKYIRNLYQNLNRPKTSEGLSISSL